jgi:ornithine decarboxylase
VVEELNERIRGYQAPPPAPDGVGMDRIDCFLAERCPETPCIVIDLDIVRAQYHTLRAVFPDATIFYAVKANPATKVIAALAELGCNFDLASAGEILRCQTLGIGAERLSFGNIIKREAEIADTYARGIDLFAFDSIAELEKLSRAAPGARVYCRAFGLRPRGGMAAQSQIWLCHKHDHRPLASCQDPEPQAVGISFHIGSQQTDPQQWTTAIANAARVFLACAKRGLDLDLHNVGGGFPAHYRTPVPSIAAYAGAIDGAICAHFRAARPQLFVEPGRYMVGDAGILRSQVLLLARKSHHAGRRWVYVDAGR